MTYRYRADVLEALWRHGVQPRADTSPELVRDYVNDLYRYELRRLRDRLLRGEFPKTSYYARVVALRNRYRLLALRAPQWVTAGPYDRMGGL